MKKGIIILFTLLSISRLSAGNAASTTYANFSDIFGIDPNAGTNSFLTLLIPSGGKYEGMGTAFTAMSLDSGFLDANPAGSSFIKNSELTFFHNNWIADTNLESVTYTSRWEDFGIGIGGKFLYLPFTGIDDWGDRAQNGDGSYSSGYYTETVMTLNAAYTFLDNYYYHGLALGANVKMAYRGVPYSIAPDQSAVAVMADIGIQTKFNVLKFFSSRDKNFAFGFVVKNLGSEFITDPDPLPSMISTGIAYSPIRPMTWAFDVNIPFNLDGSKAEKVSYAVGLDLGLTSFLSVQSGFQIKTGLPRFSVGSSLDLEKFSVTANYTLDLTTQVSSLDRFSLALKLNLGDFGRMTRVERSQLLYLQGLEEYANGDISQAIAYWEESLEVRPDFTPAEQMIETARKTLELNQVIEENQTIDE
ncbi:MULTISPECIES: UPF0164 family protein [unclassified Oceanispirochaeta]|uniref:UPF0164 family protein n=1 Tax=unclassified Oceanispirochaeta TaxID=2635722 RepID=UPI000E09B22B|nr:MULTISPECIES: UPF0164 family protein [unclassified Oceanispirochaeta]MBF9017676.1 UPF0164 family protein [Oceanispirochaeta sp. M2]NPD74248.1 hypothetical protein [Oceanispirochaeta sp. M1]RDG29954.1 hypothetical protein DV872_19295 [Oceanispirochaeta sp. M1]